MQMDTLAGGSGAGGGFCRLLKNWGSGKEGVTQWGAPPPRTHWFREPPVSLCNLMAVDIIEDWMRKTREKGVVDRVKRMMRE